MLNYATYETIIAYIIELPSHDFAHVNKIFSPHLVVHHVQSSDFSVHLVRKVLFLFTEHFHFLSCLHNKYRNSLQWVEYRGKP